MSVTPAPSLQAATWSVNLMLGPWEALARRRERAAEREAQRRLAAMPPHLLDDIGVSKAGAEQESLPPRWAAGRV